jgi:hypothetical protein
MWNTLNYCRKFISLRYTYFVRNGLQQERPAEYANLNTYSETYILPHWKCCEDALLSLSEGRK